jgi:hypothetical protein
MKPLYLLDLIKRYSTQHPHEGVSLIHPWSLLYLSPDGLTILSAIQTLLDNIKDNQSYRTQVNNLGYFRESLHSLRMNVSLPSFLQQMKKVCRMTLSLITARQLQTWETTQVAWLDNHENWQYLMDINPEAKGSLVKLQQFWCRQQQFTRCTNDFLLQAIDCLVEPTEQLAFAEAEFRKKQHLLPVVIAENYKLCLSALSRDLEQKKSALLNSMICRLIVAGKAAPFTGQLIYDDVLVYTISELQRLGILKSTMHLKGYWQTLTPDHFNRFHYFIQRDGYRNMHKELSQMPWFSKSTEAITIINTSIGNKLYMVPKCLLAYVPANKRWPAWLFKSQHQIAKFIYEHQAAFAELKLGLPAIRPFNVETRFDRLDNYAHQVQKLVHRLPEHSPSLWQWWSYFGYRQFIDRWGQQLCQLTHWCQEERFKLLEEIAYQELAPENNEARFQLWIVAREQLARFSLASLNQKAVVRLQLIEKNLFLKLQQDPGIFSGHLIQALAKQQHLKNDELKYLVEFIQINALSTDKDKWLTSISSYRVNAVSFLIQQAKEYCTRPDADLNSPVINGTLVLIQQLTNNSDKHGLQLILKLLVKIQAEKLGQEQHDVARMRILALQRLIYQFGDDKLKKWFNHLPISLIDNNWQSFLKHWQFQLCYLSDTQPAANVKVKPIKLQQTTEHKLPFFKWFVSKPIKPPESYYEDALPSKPHIAI